MDFDLQGFVRLLEEEAPLEPLTIERISMLKAQVFQLERSNALVTDALNTQHDLLNSAMNALGAMRDCILAADAEAAKGQAGGDVTVSADTWSQLAAHARRAQGSRRTTVVPEGEPAQVAPRPEAGFSATVCPPAPVEVLTAEDITMALAHSAALPLRPITKLQE
ncbi:hypothetical protein T492DRAFT_869648 [Pavlovales sp. CCMP2436]|nr:hypothetical protein T492DRAFT_869648 [Pavlovales sp. CCMP2436]